METTQIENKTNQLEKNKVDLDSLRENHKEFMKYNKLLLNHSKDLKKLIRLH